MAVPGSVLALPGSLLAFPLTPGCLVSASYPAPAWYSLQYSRFLSVFSLTPRFLSSIAFDVSGSGGKRALRMFILGVPVHYAQAMGAAADAAAGVLENRLENL